LTNLPSYSEVEEHERHGRAEEILGRRSGGYSVWIRTGEIFPFAFCRSFIAEALNRNFDDLVKSRHSGGNRSPENF
jgi:hypothetical protein